MFETTKDARGFEAALQALDDADARVAQSAIAALRGHLRGRHGVTAVGRLTAVALDRTRPVGVRLASARALLGLERATILPLLEVLRGDPSPELAALAESPRSAAEEPDDPAYLLAEAAAGQLPPDAGALRRAILAGADAAPLPNLLAVVERIREREQSSTTAERARWMASRAAAHLGLARRGSRLALYDLRETIEHAREPLPGEFLAALEAIGDAASLEALATAYAAAKRAAWRAELAAAFRAVVARERVTRRHAVVQKIDKRWKAALAELWPAGRPSAGRPS